MDLTLALHGSVLGLAFGGVFALLSAGVTPIYAVTRQVNVAHGTFLTFSLYVNFNLYTLLGLDPYVSVFLSAPIMGFIGLIVFKFGFKRLLNADPLVVFQFFLGYVLILESVMLIFFGADFRSIPSFIVMHKTMLGPFVFRTAQVIAFMFSTLICLGCHFVLMWTDFGRAVRATAQNPEVAMLMGINVPNLQMKVFIFGFVLLGFAANMAAPLMTYNPYTGLTLTLFAMIKMVMGGMGSFLGVYLAGLAIGLIYGLSYAFVPSQFAAVIPYVFFLIVMLAKPQGLVERR
jgi:branched-chain amino acid transport system permease protein